jgi:hypothetical protein
VLVEATGVPVGIAVEGANRNDMKMVRETLESIPVERPEPTPEEPQGMCMDKGYDYDDVRAIVVEFGFTAHIRSRGEHNAVVLDMAYSFLRHHNKSKELAVLAVRAAEALLCFSGGKEPDSLLRLADAYFASGDKAKAKEYARRAMDAAAGESATFRQDIEKEARRLGVKE